MRIFLVLAMLLAALPALAQDGRRMLADHEAGQWAAVGRVNIQDGGFCTGALIAEDIVLTAAHCVFHQRSQRQVATNRLHFVAGWRKGELVAHRRVARVILHRDYSYLATEPREKVERDVALLVLQEPIPRSLAQPFLRQRRPVDGQPLSIVSYARDRSEAPSIEDRCSAMQVSGRVVVMDCDVTYGVSGSPVFSLEGGEPRITSVVSAMARIDGRKVALGMTLDDGTLNDLLLAARRGAASFEAPRGSLSEQLGRSAPAPLFTPARER